MHKKPSSTILVSGLTLTLALFAGHAAAAVSADLVGKDSNDSDNKADSVGPFNFGTMKADLGALTLASASLNAGGGRTIGFADSAGISSGATLTVTLTNGKVDSATDQSYYLALIDSGAGGAGTIDAVATDIVSGAAVLSSGDSVLTFTTSTAIAADAQVVVVRSKDATSTSAHSYSDGNTAQSPTWIINQDATTDVTAAITGGSTTGFVRVALARQPKLATTFTTIAESIDTSNPNQFSSYVRSEYRLICGQPKYNATSNQSYDDFDTDKYPAMKLILSDDLPSGGLIDVGKTAGWTDFTAGQMTVTTVIHGPMAPVSAVYWDMDGSGTFDADEKFTIDTNANTATLAWDPANSSNDQVSGANRNFKIQFNGTTALTPGSVYYPTVSASTGTVAATLNGTAYVDKTGNLMAANGSDDLSLCHIGGMDGARFRPNYLWSGRDVFEQFVRIGVDLSAGPLSAAEYGKTSFDVYARAKQISGANYVKVGTVPAASELVVWGYEVRTAMQNAGYAISSVAQRLDVDFIVQGLGTNYFFDTVNNPNKAFKLNVVSIQRSPRGDRVIPIRAVRQDASTNDVVSVQ